jgi:hypothetical protein
MKAPAAAETGAGAIRVSWRSDRQILGNVVNQEK